MTTWQDISTAPRDGTRILLANHLEVDAGKFWFSANIKRPRGRWVWNGYPHHEPTHWTPLPPPPEGK